jgi:septal ring factor EnvC (AmiA/AmiB activator)
MRRLAIASFFVVMVIGSVRADNERNFQLRKSIVAEQKRIEELKKLSSDLEKSRKEFVSSHKERISSRNADIRRIIDDMTALSTEYRKEQALLSVERNKIRITKYSLTSIKIRLSQQLRIIMLK